MENETGILETENGIPKGKTERTISQTGIWESETDFAAGKNGRTESHVGLPAT
jgi:hypothetical protein